MKRHNNTSGKYFLGALFIIGGILLLASNLNLLPFAIPPYIFSWKILLIAIGLFFMFHSRRLFPPIVLIAVGVYFLLPDLGIPRSEIRPFFWPALFILVGLAILTRSERCRQRKHWRKRFFDHSDAFEEQKKKLSDEQNLNTAVMDTTVIFGGEDKQISSYDFKGGKLTAVCGGIEIDLTNCTLAKENPMIEVSIVCGGISLTVPREWNVRSEVVPILGGVNDTINKLPNDTYVDPAAELIIKGTIIMGGLEIKRA